MKGSGSPIGATGKIRWKPVSFSIKPGNRLVLYTDGLVESLPTQETVDAFDQFRLYIGLQPWLSVSDTCKNILDGHPFFQTGLPQPDDFTVVILERAPQAEKA